MMTTTGRLIEGGGGDSKEVLAADKVGCGVEMTFSPPPSIT